MKETITFLNINILWPVFIGGIFLLLVFIWKEWTSTGRQRFSLKIVLMVLALLSLSLIALKPAIPNKMKAESWIVITDNYNPSQLDSLMSTYETTQVVDYTQDGLLSRIPHSAEVFILGSGVQAYDIPSLEHALVSYLPGDDVSGVTQLQYSEQAQVGDVLEVKGEFQEPGLDHSLVLESSAGTPLDSVVFSSENSIVFNLSTPLKTEGRYLFHLVEKDTSGQDLDRKPLPVIIHPKSKFQVLLLNSFPTFEMKYLKNWLAENGHPVAVRNRISKGKFKFEFLNRERINLSRLSTSTLNATDLLIADATSIDNLSPLEENRLQTAIQEDGLGLLVLDEVTQLTSLSNFSVFEFQQVSATSIQPDGLVDVEVDKQPYEIKAEVGLEEIQASNSSILSAYKRVGQGRIGTTILQRTWQLQLEGKQEAYQKLWSKILESLIKSKPLDIAWNSESTFAFLDEPFKIKLRTSHESPRLRDENHHAIPLHQDFKQPEVWSATLYPKQMGWKNLSLESDTTSTFGFYVHPSQPWSALRSYQAAQANRRYFQQQSYQENEPRRSPVAINPLWFFGVFLLSMGGLWLEPKL